MASLMTPSTSRSYTFEGIAVFRSRMTESNGREKILSSIKDVNSAASKYNTRSMSAPPIGNTEFKFHSPCSTSSILSDDSFETRSNLSRSKSFPAVQPDCIFLKKYQEQRTKKNSFLTKDNNMHELKLSLQMSVYDKYNEDLSFRTFVLEQLSARRKLKAGKSPEAEHSVNMPLPLYGSQSNAVSSPQAIVLENASEGEYFSGRICRICHDGAGTLISPCLCSGTVALVHKGCLERWLTQTSTSSCEICLFPFRVERRALPFYKVFSDTTNTKLRRTILIDLTCFICLTPLALSAICLCLLSAMQVFNVIILVPLKQNAGTVTVET